MGVNGVLVRQFFNNFQSELFDDSCSSYWRHLSHNNLINPHHQSDKNDAKKQNHRRTIVYSEIQDYQRQRNRKVNKFKWLEANEAGLILSNGTLLQMTIDGTELFFSVCKVPLINGIAQAGDWESDRALLLTLDGRLIFIDGIFKSNHHTEDFLNFPPTSNFSKKVERHLVLKGMRFLFWWSTGDDEAILPWNPKPECRANVFVYSLIELDGSRPALVWFTKIEDNLLLVDFCGNSNGEIIMVQLSISAETGKQELREFKYNFESGVKTSEVIIPLITGSQLKCFAYTKSFSTLALGFCDSSLTVIANGGKPKILKKLGFVPCQLTWHPDGNIFAVVGGRGQVQMFDVAFNSIFFHYQLWSNSPTLTVQLEPHEPVTCISWGPSVSEKTNLLLQSESGSLGVLQICLGRTKLLDLVLHHIRSKPKAYFEAISIFHEISLNLDDFLEAFTFIFRHLCSESYSPQINTHFEEILNTCFGSKDDMATKHFWKRHGPEIMRSLLMYQNWLVVAGQLDKALEVAVSCRHEFGIKKVYNNAVAFGKSSIAADAQRHLSRLKMSSTRHRRHRHRHNQFVSCTVDLESSGLNALDESDSNSPGSSSNSEEEEEEKNFRTSTPFSGQVRGQASGNERLFVPTVQVPLPNDGILRSGITVVPLGDV